jgi:hypothetical protein
MPVPRLRRPSVSTPPTPPTPPSRTAHVIGGDGDLHAALAAGGWRPAGEDTPDVVVVADPATRPEQLPRGPLRVGIVTGQTAAKWRSGRILDDLDAVLVTTPADAARVDVATVAPPVVTDDPAGTLHEVLDRLEARPRVHLVTGVSELRARHRWGDQHYAVGLARALHAAGWLPRIWCQAELADVDHGAAALVVLLPGRVPIAAVPGTPTVAWVISHPELLDDLEPAAVTGLDGLFVASASEAEQLTSRGVPATSLPQATDPSRFRPTPDGPPHELLFVANSRGQRRKVLADLLPTDRELAVYGRDWTPELLDPALLVADHISNADLAAHYTAADVVLNDHWDEMRTRGFVSNRLYDVAACGGLVLSDEVAGIDELFGGHVPTFRDRPSLLAQLDAVDADPAAAVAAATATRRIVLARHTFAHRVPVLTASVPAPPAAPWPGTEVEFPPVDAAAATRYATFADAPRPSPPIATQQVVDELATVTETAVGSASSAALATHALARVRGRRAVKLLGLAQGRPSRKRVRRALRPTPVGPPPEVEDAAGAAEEVRRRYSAAVPARIAPPTVSAPAWRVGHLGAVRRFQGVVTHVDLETAGWREAFTDGLDLVLVEPGPSWGRPEDVEEVLARCRETGTPTVLVTADDAAPAAGPAWWTDLDVDHVLREGIDDEADLPLGVAVDRWNPRGWQRVVPDPFVCAPSHLPARDRRAVADAFPTPRLLQGDALGDRVPAPRRSDDDGTPPVTPVRSTTQLIRALRTAGVLIDDVRWHAGPTEAARLRLGALALGVPVVAIGDPLGSPHVVSADDLAGATALAHDLLADLDLREQVSITARRAVLRDHGDDARFAELCTRVGLPAPAPPLVSVVVSTNRPALVGQAIETVASQRYPRLELVLVLHGEDHAAEDPAVPRADLPTTVVRAPGAWTLGDCLNAGIAVARGDLIAKVDDDDVYGAEHITDLVLAQRHSHGDVVGKRVEFVHLVGEDLTVRRDITTPERYRTHVSGPSLLLTAEVARRIGFRRLPRGVDTDLCERVVALGGRIYRTHNRDLVLVRHRAGHTWQVEEAEVRASATAERPGDGVVWASSDPSA